MRLLPPDDAADIIQEADERPPGLLVLLDEQTRKEVPRCSPTPRTTPAAS